MAVMDIIIQATDHASGVIDNISDKGGKAGSWLEENWVKVGAAGAIAGGAIEGMARAQAPLTEQTDRLADRLGMSSEEMRNLANETANVTFPLEDAVELMEKGAKRGLEGADALQEYATFWDTVGDATGENAVALADAGVALQQIGIAAGNEGEALEAFGYISENTTGGVGDFLTMVERLGPELQDMGLDVNDTAALMGVLENEMGLTGRVARQEFREAVNESGGSLEGMMDALGVTGDQLDEYKGKVEDSSGVIQDNADIHAESYTAMEKAQHWASELSYKYGDLIGMASNFAPILMTLGPLIKGVSAAKGIMAAVTSGSLIPAIGGAISSVWAFTAALLANPITWVVVGIMALIAAIVLLWKNWDEVSAFLGDAFDWLKEKAGAFITGVIEWFSQLPGRIAEIFGIVVENVSGFVSGVISKGIEMGTNFVNGIMEWFAALPGRIWGALTTALENLLTWGGQILESGKTLASNAINGIMEYFLGLPGKLWGTFTESIGKVISFGGDLKSKLISKATEAVDGFIGKAGDLPGLLWDVLKDTAGKVLDIGGQMWENAKGLGSKLWNGFKKGIGKNSPSYLEKAMDDITNKSHDMKDEMDSDFNYVNKLKPQDYTINGAIAATGAETESVRHEHGGTMRVIIENAVTGYEEVRDIVIDEIRRGVRE